MKMQVLLDTNFLMIPYQDGVDIFQEIARLVDAPYELLTLSTVKEELTKIKEHGKGKEKIAASVGLQLLEAKGVKIIESPKEKKPDEEIIEIALKNNKETIVCTNDAQLKKTLRKNNIPIISIRSGNHLDYS